MVHVPRFTIDPVKPEQIDDDMLAVLKAVDRFRRREGCRFPTITQVLQIAMLCGWRRPIHHRPK